MRELLCRTCGLDGTVVVLVRVRNVAHGQVLSSSKMKLRLARLFIPHFCKLRRKYTGMRCSPSLEIDVCGRYLTIIIEVKTHRTEHRFVQPLSFA